MENILMKPIVRKSIYGLVSLAALSVLVLMSILIYEQIKKNSSEFVFSLNASSGEPYFNGKLIEQIIPDNFQDGKHATVIEIPEQELAEVRRTLLNEESFISSMDSWTIYEADQPLEKSFRFCQNYLERESTNWLIKPAAPESRYVITQQKNTESSYKFVIVDLTEKRIFSCGGV